MYTENGTTYVVGIEQEFMGYWLKFHRKQYRYKEKLEEASPEQIEKVNRWERERRESQAAKYLAEHPEVKAETIPGPKKPKPIIVVKSDVEQLDKQARKEYHRQWFQLNKERELAKQRERYARIHGPIKQRAHNKQDIPYMAGTKEYNKEYYKRNKENYKRYSHECYERAKNGETNQRNTNPTWGSPKDYPDASTYRKAYRQANLEDIRRKDRTMKQQRRKELKKDPEKYEEFLRKKREYMRQWNEKRRTQRECGQ